MDEGESKAWSWLMAFPKLDWQEHTNRETDDQVLVHMRPGKLRAMGGAPYVKVTLRHPGNPGKRYKGTGNSLAKACGTLLYEIRKDRLEHPEPFAEMWF